MTKRNGKRPARNSLPSGDYVETVVGADVSETVPTPIRNLLSKDFPLANLTREDREYFRLLADNIALYLKERYPPEDSVVQGRAGAALLDDPSFNKTALSQRKRNEIETDLLARFARTGRGVDGWQQDKLSENIETQRLEDERTDEDEDTGVTGRLFS